MSLRKQIVRDGLIYYLSKIVPGLVGFISVPLIISYFGEEVYGKYTIYISSIFIVNTFVSGWLGQSYIRYYSEQKDKIKFELNVFKLWLVSIVIFSITFLVIQKCFNINSIVGLVNILLLFSVTMYSVNIESYKAKFLSKKVLFSDLIRSILFFTLLLVVVKTEGFISFNSVLFLLFINFVSFFILNLINLKDNVRFKFLNLFSRQNLDLKIISKIIKYGFPVSLWLMVSFLLNVSDRYIIKMFFSFSEVGEYSAIYDVFSKLVQLVFSPILIAIYPIIVKENNSGRKEKANRLIYISVAFEILIFSLLFIIIYFIKEFVVFDVLKITKKELVRLVMPIFSGTFLWTLAMLVHKPLELKEKTFKMLVGVVIAFVFNIVTNFIYIPKFGIIAAAYTTLFSSFVYIIIILFINLMHARKIKA